ncbi:MAG: AbrB/MazE/SpoVT family DNA-binding domain-containing protein [Parvibaculaceae bacterium]
MRMTSKSQVTVPKFVRERMGIGPGSNMGFEERDGEFVLVDLDARKGETAGERAVRILREFGERARAEGRLHDLTTDEIMEMTRGPFDDVDPR